MEILDKIEFVKRDVGGDIPNIYLLHGDLEDSEMNELYNHPKVKAHVSFTHGEGFGRPLLEASLSGKPILFSKWSGHIDFLPATLSTALDGTMVGVPKASFPKDMFVDGMGWFAVNYGKAINLMKDVYGNYNKYKPIFQHLGKSNTHKFTRSKMGEKFVKIVDEMIAGTPKQVNIKLPKLKKIDGGQTGAIKPPTGLPKLKKA
jgi:glycosyltransferase involved in cell wall biosynthesis